MTKRKTPEERIKKLVHRVERTVAAIAADAEVKNSFFARHDCWKCQDGRRTCAQMPALDACRFCIFPTARGQWLTR